MSYNFSAGSLTELVTVYTRTSTQDSIGGEVISWSALPSSWAHIETANAALAGERFIANRLNQVEEYFVWMYLNTSISASSKLTWDGRDFGITSVYHNKLEGYTRLSIIYGVAL